MQLTNAVINTFDIFSSDDFSNLQTIIAMEHKQVNKTHDKKALRFSLLLSVGVAFSNILPVDNLPDVLQVVSTDVLVLSL